MTHPRAEADMDDRPIPSNSELYEALYGLNRGIDTTLRALRQMSTIGALAPFLPGHIILIEGLQAWVRNGVIGLLNDVEREEWSAYETARRHSERMISLLAEKGTSFRN
jgi:hypothetical protein